MGKLTIQEVSKILVEKNGLEPEAASSFVAEFFNVIQQQLQQGDQVKVKGLGTFKIINVEARESVSVRTGERVVIDSHSKVTFVPDAVMKELVNKPFSQFETVVLNEGVEFADMKDDEPEEPQEEPQPAIEEEPQPATVVSGSAADIQPALEASQPATVVSGSAADAQPAIEEAPATVVSGSAADAPDEKETPWLRWLLMALGAVLLILLAAWGGYQYGIKQHPAVADTIVVRDTVYMAEEDSISEAEAIEEATSEPAEEAAIEPAKEAPPTPEPAPAKEVLDKWSAKDERVRLGAYRIVGTAEEVKVQAGQTFYSICRAHLGPDMQCYVEVYNDLPSNPTIKEGQVIKIPKLQLKKRK